MWKREIICQNPDRSNGQIPDNERRRTAARVTREQIEAAKRWDLLSYLQTYEPQELVKSGPHEFSTRTHDSLKISNGLWCWNREHIGGRSALDYLIKVRGMEFTDAVRVLCDGAPADIPRLPVPKKRSLALPERAFCPSSVVPYLRNRGIDGEIINVCLKLGILYENKRYRDCVFVGIDPSGRKRFACLRGTHDGFKRDAPGSDKRYSFVLPTFEPNCNRVAVAESPIDALSLATLVKCYCGDWWGSNYLSLGGTAPRAAVQYLQDHPQITQVSLCLDNDRAGTEGMEGLEKAIRDNPTLSKRIGLIYRNPPPIECGKDYNEFLCAQVKREEQRRQPSRTAVR